MTIDSDTIIIYCEYCKKPIDFKEENLEEQIYYMTSMPIICGECSKNLNRCQRDFTDLRVIDECGMSNDSDKLLFKIREVILSFVCKWCRKHRETKKTVSPRKRENK